MIRCVIIDDEPLAREGLANYIKEVDFLSLAGQGANALELNKLLSDTEVDLIFMDIQMPIISGIEFLKITPNLPKVILTTAYPSYALEGFELDVVDYLLKPITFNRFLKAVTKAYKLHIPSPITSPIHPEASIEQDFFFVKCDNRYEKIYFNDILFVQALQNYVTFFTTQGKIVSLLPLKQAEGNLENHGFIRTHKSYIVSISKIDRMESHELTIGSHKIPIGRNFRKEVKEKVLGNTVWRQERG
ncbi:LytTR family transcriptional regulator DNA-binding domain-containing protein [Aureisphaera galaxeae]|uniref:LytR/AlgR family response regulator transcription factor n=1 Tax=Aureisphaera galaxeae TaxID=1538023 RepID=UPI002350A39B|nr:LytTR family transcriptional regulator DNA-binding domain-containing protein [Aureisphaera galaxeae]MDC8002832.1 LytTR family transcriptional regulator DNA-binding domain-containing protein [Aureisphaera galaxeae]